MIFTNIVDTVSYSLSPNAIDEISERIESFCAELKIDGRNTKKYRLSAEESLSLWMRKFGENTEITVEFGKKLFSPFIRLQLKGAQYNPYSHSERAENYGTFTESILIRIGLIPEFNYRYDTNILTFRLQKAPKNPILVLLVIILAAILVGFSCKTFLPPEFSLALSENVISPIVDTFFNILSAIAGPLIFLSVAWGVYGIGDVYTLGRIGKKLMLQFIKVIFFVVAFGALFYPLLGPALSGFSEGANQFSKIFQMFLSIFPSDIFSPFINGNALQIIFLAFIIGLSLIFLGQRTSSVARAVEQINHLINFLMNFVAKLIPFFVFIVLVNVILSGALNTFTATWKFTVVFLIAAFLCNILILVFVSVKHKQSPFTLLKLILPSYLIAISTASSSAAFESNMNICNNKFGVNKELSSFGIPFGMVIFKPTTALYYLLICFYFASVYAVPVSISWIVTAVIISAVSAIATPPIPGGAAATYTILFSQLGINPAGLTVVIAIDIIFDFLLTSNDMYFLLLEMFHVSKKMGMRRNDVSLNNSGKKQALPEKTK